MSGKKTPSLDEFADAKAQAVHAENEDIARRLRVARAEVKSEQEKTAAAIAERDASERALSLYQRKYDDRPDWLSAPKQAKPGQATVFTTLSDVHAAETVRPGEMQGYNAFNLRICEARLRRFFELTVRLAESWSMFKYDGCVLALGGDAITGEIHEELAQTNECSNQEAILWLVPRISEGVEVLRKAFKRVKVASAPGNHGRDGKIPRYKGRSAHNADTMIARLVAMQFSSVPDVSFEIPESLDTTFPVYDWQFSLEHGEELAKSFSGSAEIGALGPLVRGTNRKKNAYAAEGKRLDYCVWGHFHQLVPVASRGFIANGSVKGYDEYARGLKLKPEPPQQALFAVTPEHGATTSTPILLLDRKAEGW